MSLCNVFLFAVCQPSLLCPVLVTHYLLLNPDVLERQALHIFALQDAHSLYQPHLYSQFLKENQQIVNSNW